nr:HAD-IIA family hydrolase [uncultured Oscillibacter sp.]
MIDLRKKTLFLLDMDGTIYLGDRLFDGTLDFLRRVRERGGRYLFATNNSSRSVTAYVERLRGMGIDAEAEDFLTSVDATVWYLRNHGFQDTLIYASGTRTFQDQLRQAGFRVTDRREAGIGLLLHGFDTELTFQKLEDSCILLGDPKVDFIATNPDWVCPTAWGSVPDCGSVCEMLFRATGRRPKVIGKPEPEMALLAMDRWGCSKEETVLVGDRIYTDIACGVRAGIDTGFVLSGEGVPEDIEKYGVQPSETYRDIREILEKMD